MLVTKNLLRQVALAMILCLFNIVDTSATANGFAEKALAGTKTVALGAFTYEIEVDLPDLTGKSEIRAIDCLTGMKPTYDVRFFIILPDGNFLSLTKNSDLQFNYQSKIRFEQTGSASYKISDMQVFAFKKSDPIPPPLLSVSYDPQYNNNSLATFVPAGPILNATDYLGSGVHIKLGTSWAPWDYKSNSIDEGEFYFLIISYANRTGSTITSGTIDLDSCGGFSSTGFSPVRYTTFNIDGNHGWTINGGLSSGNSFSFSNLLPDEVRHIYVKVAITGTVTTAPHEYVAKMILNSVTHTSECLKILTEAFPHDPNKKIVDQSFCTRNGHGELIYTIYYQNIGEGYADKVTIVDKFPKKYIKSTTLTLLNKSSNIPPYLTIEHPWFGLCNKVKFTIGDCSLAIYRHQLAGLAQTNPRHFSYDETIAWIQFKVDAVCPSNPSTLIENRAKIKFFDQGCNGLPSITTDAATTTPDDLQRPNQWKPGKGD